MVVNDQEIVKSSTTTTAATSHPSEPTRSPSPTVEPTITDPSPTNITSTARIDLQKAPLDTASSNLSVRVSSCGVLTIARTQSAIDAQRTNVPQATISTSLHGITSSQPVPIRLPVIPPYSRRGRAPVSASVRVADALDRRSKLVAEIHSRYDETVASGKYTFDEAFSSLVPLDQILPSPPEWLLHQLAIQWMQPTEKETERGATLRLHLRDSFGRGTELQLLCAMAGLPVLPSSGNNHSRMRQYIFAAVRAYAMSQPNIFTSQPLEPEQTRFWWENDVDSHAPSITPEVRAATQQAIAAAITLVDGALPNMHNVMHNIMHNETAEHEGELCASLLPPPQAIDVPSTFVADSDRGESPRNSSHMDTSAPSSTRPGSSPSFDLFDLTDRPPLIGRLPARLDTSPIPEALMNEVTCPGVLSPAVADISPAPLAVVVQSIRHIEIQQLLADLHPSCATSVLSLLEANFTREWPWLRSSLQAASSTPRRMLQTSAVKRRLACAAAVALEMRTITTDAQLRDICVPYSLESILAVPSLVPAGRAVYTYRLHDIYRYFGWPRSSKDVDVEEIDMAAREMLRAFHHAGSDSLREKVVSVLQELKDLSRHPYVEPQPVNTLFPALHEPSGVAPRSSLSLTGAAPNEMSSYTNPTVAQLSSPNRFETFSSLTDPQPSRRSSTRQIVPSLAVVEAQVAAIDANLSPIGPVTMIDNTTPDAIPTTKPIIPYHLRWRPEEERPPAKQPSTAENRLAENATHPLQIPSLARIAYIPISGQHNRCFRNAIARHFSILPSELQPIINDTLMAITDSATLARYGLSVEYDADPDAVAIAKTRYLQSRNTIEGTWGGSLEMCLLSHARDGDISFVVIDAARKQTAYYGSRPENDPMIRLEIPLHHCHLEGDNHRNMRPNHWATFDYIMSDGSTRIAWTDLATESTEQKNRRIRLLHAAAAQQDLRARTLAKTSEGASARAAIDLHRELNDSSPPRNQVTDSTVANQPSRSPHTNPSRGRRAHATRGERGGHRGRRGLSHQHDHETHWRTPRPVHLPTPHKQSEQPSVPPLRRTGAPTATNIGSPPRAAGSSHLHSPSRLIQSRLMIHAMSSPRTPIVSTNSRGSWKQRRVNTHREIHGRPHQLYCQTASRLCEIYYQVASIAQPDRSQQAQVASSLMDYTGRALYRGHRIGMRRKCELMDQLGTQVLKDLDDTLSAPPPPPQNVLDPNRHSQPGPTGTTSVNRQDIIEISDSEDDDTPGPLPGGDVPVVPTVTADIRPSRPPLPRALHSSTIQPRPPGRIPNPNEVQPETSIHEAIRKCNFILAQGGPHCIQRAARSLASAPLAPLTPETISKLRDLHPTATDTMGNLPDAAVGIADIDPARLDSVLRKRIHNGSAPGASGMTGSHLLALWDSASPSGQLGFQLLIRDICNGVFDGDMKDRLLACVLVPLSKKDNGVRPVAVAEVFVRCAAHYMISLIEDEMQDFFPRIQFGVKFPGGSEAAAQLTRAELAYAATRHNDVIALKIDFRNAFNAILRTRVWAALCAHPKAAPILRAFHYQYADSSPLLVYDGNRLFAELRSSNGVRQGCPFAAFAFALTVQPLYEAALREAPDCNGFSIQDDFTIVGPSPQVMRAYDYLKSHAQVELGLELVTAKCQVFLPSSLTSSDCLESIRTLCSDRHLPHSREMESLGVMFGPDANVKAHCDKIVENSQHFFDCISHPSMLAQTASLLLRYCAIPKLGYLARTTHPDVLLGPAQQFDEMAMKAQLAILHQTEESLSSLEPHTGDPDTTIHDPGDGDPPTGSQPKISTNRISAITKDQLLQRMKLPLSLGGLGLRSVVSIRYAAYFASLQQILPYFARLHPELSVASVFQQTQLYRDLLECQEKLIEAGAANRFEMDTAGLESPPAVESSTAVPSPMHDPHYSTTPDNLASAVRMIPGIQPNNASSTPTMIPPVNSAAKNHIRRSTPSRSPKSFSSTRFPSPSIALLQSIDATWQLALRSIVHSSTIFSVYKLQHDLTRSLEATSWMKLFNNSGRYQQATLTALSLNPSTSTWLTTLPLSSEPGYRMRDEDFRLAIRHRLGQLPFDSLRSSICIGCARRNLDAPSLLEDPDHAHSCALQEGTSIRRRHDRLKNVLGQLARSCGYHVEIEPRFPSTIELRLDPSTGQYIHHVHQPQIHGDLLLVRNNIQQLIDVTVVRPTTRTLLRGSASNGSHLVPLVATAQAEKRKHHTYDIECSKHGWKMIPFAIETLGATGSEATCLLQSMAAHSIDQSPEAFLLHATRLLSMTLQSSNAHVSGQGTSDLLVHSYRHSDRPQLDQNSIGRGPGRNHLRRAASATTVRASSGPTGLGTILHSEYRSARCTTGVAAAGGVGMARTDLPVVVPVTSASTSTSLVSDVIADSASGHVPPPSTVGISPTLPTRTLITIPVEPPVVVPATTLVPATTTGGIQVHFNVNKLQASTSQPHTIQHDRRVTSVRRPYQSVPFTAEPTEPAAAAIPAVSVSVCRRRVRFSSQREDRDRLTSAAGTGTLLGRTSS